MKITKSANEIVKVTGSSVSFNDSGGFFGGGSLTVQDVLDLIGAGTATGFLTVIRGGQGTTQDIGTLGPTATVDLANANYFFGTLAEDCTLTTTGWTPDKDSQITVEITEDGTGGWTPTFDGVTWIGGTPTWDTTLDTVTIVILFSRDGGTTIYGVVVGGGGSALTIEDEGTPLATAADTLDFVGAGVTATGTGATKTITIPGASGGVGAPLEQHTASSSASLDFTAFISSTYDEYMIEGVNLIPATNGAHLYAQVGTGGGPTYDTGANYYIPSNQVAYRLATTVSNAAAYGQASFSLRFMDPQSTAQMKQLFGLAAWHDGTVWTQQGVGGLWAVTTAVTAIRFLFSSGNIASGTIRVYGVAKT